MSTEVLNASSSKSSGIRLPSLRLKYSEDEGDMQEGEGKVKTKLKSMWNNMKYGWTVKIKTNFSKDSPVWLLGRCYHRKLDSAPEAPYEESVVGEDAGIEGFKVDFISRIWLTYRREFPILNGSNFTTDCGWGCMLRSGQMMLAQALVYHFLGRDWKWHASNNPNSSSWHFREDSQHRKIIKWFGDNPSKISPLSIHSLVALGEASGKKAGDWYGPASVAHLLRQAMDNASKESPEFRDIQVYVSQDCAVYIQDILDECGKPEDETATVSHEDVEDRDLGTSWVDVKFVERMKATSSKQAWKSLILLVPVRLGAEKLNSIYGPCLTGLLTLENCIGIIGGRPNHSLYFVGFQDDKLIHLDPHYCQEMVDVWQPCFPLNSFHCRSPRKMSILRMDPSCCIGFYCRTRADFDNFVKVVEPYLIPPQQKSEYPMFVFCEGRSKDALNIPKFNIPDDTLPRSDVEDEFESEEFELL